MRQLFVTLALIALACSYRPARFADRAPVTELGDDRPIAVPRRNPLIEPVYLSEIYLERPLLDALDAERFPYARDVNALDEVPRSSFWDPGELAPARAEPKAHTAHETLIDDPRGQPGTRSAAAVIARRLVRALGYLTPEVSRVTSSRARMRWPIGIVLGPTDPSLTRKDDPNDGIPHRDRRTLRALGVVAYWLDLRELGPKQVVDVYAGAPGRGHVRHFVLGLEKSLGVASLPGGGVTETAAGVIRGNALENLVTLGLTRPKQHVAQHEPSLLVFSKRLDPSFVLAHPWEPSDRLLPSDGYWIAKRIARIPSELIEHSVRAAELEPEQSQHLIDALEARRTALVARWFRAVTPLELVACESRRLVLSDHAIRLGFASDSDTRYEVSFLASDGTATAPATIESPHANELAIELPKRALARDYFVLRITGKRQNRMLPRAFEAHVSMHGGPHVVGIRH